MKNEPFPIGVPIGFLIAASFFVGLSANGAVDWRTYTPPVVPIEINGETLAKNLFVSPTGDDASDGSSPEKTGSSGPFATIERARDEIRKFKHAGGLPKGGIAVNLLGGVHSLQRSLELTAEDSGTEESPIVYRPYQGQEARLAGGQVLKPSDFSAITDATVIKRLAPEAVGHVVAADLNALKLHHTGPFPDTFSDGGGIFELLFNGQRMKLSRWPYNDYTTMKQVLVVGDKKTPGVFEYRDEEPARWNPSSGVWLKGQWRVGWEDPAIKVASIDPVKKQIVFAVGLPMGIGSKYNRPLGSGKEKWCAINLLEEIRQPGQWCIDFSTQKLYFWPPTPIEKADILVSQLDQPLVKITDSAHLAFIGLIFEDSLGDGIVIRNGSRDLIAGCTFRNLGGNGIDLNGMGCGIQSCDMNDLGEGCIRLSGGDRLKLIPSCNYAVNNHLHNYGVLKAQYSAAINTARLVEYKERPEGTAVGCLVAHNLIHHAPRDAFLYGGNDNVYEFNEIHRCAYDTADTGVFYTCMDWTVRGAVIRYNFMHDTVGGVNPDDGASGAFAFGNILAGERTGIWIASGPDNTIQNNIFIKEKGPVFGIDDRGVSRKYATNQKLLGGVQEIHPTEAPWAERYPEMVHLLEQHPELPLRTLFKGNVIYIKDGEPYGLHMNKQNNTNPELITIEDNLVTKDDPGFVDLAAGNYALRKDSEIFNKIPGFQPIPFEKMGLYIDKYRKRLPTPSEAGRLPEQDPWKADDTNRHFGT